MFDDYTLEELQRLGVDPKLMDKDQLAMLQQRMGINADGIFGPQTAKALQDNLGVKVDGKWGKQSSGAYANAWTQARNDEQQYQNALAQGRTNQLVQDFTDFYNNEQAKALEQEKARQEKIAKLESQIAMVKERIERNKRALVGKSYEDVNRKLAQLDMKKVGLRLNHNNANTDPTNLWRWNQGRLDTKEANSKVDGRALQKWGYEIQPTLQQEINPYNYQEQREQLKNVRTLIANGRALGASKEQLMPLLEKEAELTDLVSSTFKNEATSRTIKSQMAQYDKQLQQGTLKAAEYRDKIQGLLDTLPEGYEEIRQELETKLKFGKKKATPSSIPQV